jgi:hypothetical protein
LERFLRLLLLGDVSDNADKGRGFAFRISDQRGAQVSGKCRAVFSEHGILDVPDVSSFQGPAYICFGP